MKLLASVLVLIFGILTCPAETDDFTMVLGKKTDSAKFVVKGGQLEVDIVSPGGIGRVELGLKKDRVELGIKKEAGKWPEAVVLLLRSENGKPLKELEGFSISGKTMRISGSRRTSGQMEFHEGKPGARKPGDKKPRKVKVVVEKTATAMQVTIPGHLLAGETGIKIQWIDFYR